MMRPVDSSATEPTIRVALSSIELSLLAHVAFDPEALPAIRSGQRLNTVDADDSNIPRHAVPLDAWPEPLWRALAGTFVGLGEPAVSQVDLRVLYAVRIVSDRVDRAA